MIERNRAFFDCVSRGADTALPGTVRGGLTPLQAPAAVYTVITSNSVYYIAILLVDVGFGRTFLVGCDYRLIQDKTPALFFISDSNIRKKRHRQPQRIKGPAEVPLAQVPEG